MACTSSAGSGVWIDYTPSHLFTADLASGDPHTQYVYLSGGTVRGKMLGSLLASGAPQADNEVATRAWTLSNPASSSGFKFLALPINLATWTASSAYVDIDISTYIGSDTAKAAYLAVELYIEGAGLLTYSLQGSFQKKNFVATAMAPKITVRQQNTEAGAQAQTNSGGIIVECDENNIFQVKLIPLTGEVCPTTISFTIDLIGYIT